MSAVFYRAAGSRLLELAAAITAGKIYALPDGRAGVFGSVFGSAGAAQGDVVPFRTDGQYTVTKKTGEVWIDGCSLWLDHSTDEATSLEPIGSSDKDFFIGVSVGDAASTDATGTVDLNVRPSYIIDSTRDNGDTIIVKTVVGSTTVEVPNLVTVGGMLRANLGTTNEVQKVDWISDRGFALTSNWVFEALVEVFTAPDNAAVDVDVGVASATHASDFESIAEFAAFHLDGDDTNIDAHSDDGTTDVAPTDTTTDWTAGTPFRLVLDGRDPNNVRYYVNGVEVNSGAANLGDIDAGAGPLYAIFHMEKTADDSPGVIKARLRVRTCQQNTLGTL